MCSIVHSTVLNFFFLQLKFCAQFLFLAKTAAASFRFAPQIEKKAKGAALDTKTKLELRIIGY